MTFLYWQIKAIICAIMQSTAAKKIDKRLMEKAKASSIFLLATVGAFNKMLQVAIIALHLHLAFSSKGHQLSQGHMLLCDAQDLHKGSIFFIPTTIIIWRNNTL